MRINPDTAPLSAQPPWTPGGPPGRQEPEPSAPKPDWSLAPEKDPLDYDDGAWM